MSVNIQNFQENSQDVILKSIKQVHVNFTENATVVG